jgi:hypothetical protein
VKILDSATGSLHPLIDGDTRITDGQSKALLKTAQQDPAAEVVGMDHEVRPIVRAKQGGAKKPSEWALFAGGRPVPIMEPWLEHWE